MQHQIINRIAWLQAFVRKNLGVLLFILSGIWWIAVKGQPCNTGNTIGSYPKPLKCFEIVSVLVDACDGSNEGQNEMIRLVVGNKTLAPGLLSVPSYKTGRVNWGSGAQNDFLGFSEGNASLKLKFDKLNNKIKSAGNCGHLIFVPNSGRIPQYSQALIITSESFNPDAQDFSDLQDTLYVVVQKSGNTAGHFVNFGAASTREFILQYNGDCGDTVEYDRGKLVKINGSTGGEDGAVVDFDFSGMASYINYGCRVPAQKISVSILSPTAVPCGIREFTVVGKVLGSGCYQWKLESGSFGYFDNSQVLRTKLTVKPSFSGKLKIILQAWGTCSIPVSDTVEVDFTANPMADFVVDSSAKPYYCFTRTDKNASSWIWKGGNFTKDTAFSTTTWCDTLKEGKQNVCLVVANSSGCKDTVCKEIFVSKEPVIPTEPFFNLANVFSPGDPKDGKNDVWRFPHFGVASFQVRVYNRWGQLVYESTNPAEGWNGKMLNAGPDLPGGTYVYSLTYRLTTMDQEAKNNGVVTLIR